MSSSNLSSRRSQQARVVKNVGCPGRRSKRGFELRELSNFYKCWNEFSGHRLSTSLIAPECGRLVETNDCELRKAGYLSSAETKKTCRQKCVCLQGKVRVPRRIDPKNFRFSTLPLNSDDHDLPRLYPGPPIKRQRTNNAATLI